MSLVTEKELCQMLGVSRNLIHKLRNQGLPFVRIGEKLIRYDLHVVKAWFVERSNSDACA